MIYLDNAATTKPLEEAVGFASQYLTEKFYNPSASYFCAQDVSDDIEAARREIVSLVADPQKFDLVFTSGGTEADNLAVRSFGNNIIISAGEHSAVYNTARSLYGEKTVIAPIDRYGAVVVDSLVDLIDDDTSLVSVMHVNNETGAINDIAHIGKMVKERNPCCIFHSDGVQAFGKLDFKLTDNIDMYSISAHKIGGAKGTGALIYRKAIGNRIIPQICGGKQERRKRAGTENVFGIMAFYKAVQMQKEILELQNRFNPQLVMRDMIDKSIFEVISPSKGSPYILTLSLKGGEGEALQLLLESQGVIVGTGSACSSHDESHRVLTACGYSKEISRGAIRISFNSKNTLEEIKSAAHIINACGRKIRGLS